MRRIVLALMSTGAAVVLLFGYRTSTPHPALTTTSTVATGTGGTGGTSTDGSATSVPSPPASSGTKTVDGQAVQTRYGPVQVEITVSSGTITAVTMLQVPSANRRDVEINDRAVPVLTQEALEAQSAKIDGVSGATYTSDGYVGSLQSAIDQAGL